ncbi:glycerophosphodiester phosphodiesterase [Georgenia sp. Z1344]|uniref:glycerophosphodiester phosphodiesterase n=1 Tax=Georgenia sp. Z1344 TaxID=3416706 RepID=UPI003CF29C5F
MPRIDAGDGTRADQGPVRRERVEVLGHRGASAVHPENTPAAFERAVLDGAHGVELDTHLSADGVPVVRHDLVLDVPGRGPCATRDLTAAELARLGVPTLRESLEAIREAGRAAGQVAGPDAARGPGRRSGADDPWVLVEIKSAPDGSVACAAPREVVAAVGEVLDDDGPPCVLESFDRAVVAAAADLLPHVPRAVLADADSTRPGSPFLGPPGGRWSVPDPVAAAVELGAVAVAPRHTWLGADLARRARAAGLGIWAWTVNTNDDAERATGLGATVLITDDPAALLDGRGGRPGVHAGATGSPSS